VFLFVAPSFFKTCNDGDYDLGPSPPSFLKIYALPGMIFVFLQPLVSKTSMPKTMCSSEVFRKGSPIHDMAVWSARGIPNQKVKAMMDAALSSSFFCTTKDREGEECVDDSFLSFLKKGTGQLYGAVYLHGP
jgi:hypothetical protein